MNKVNINISRSAKTATPFRAKIKRKKTPKRDSLTNITGKRYKKHQRDFKIEV